MFLCMAVFTGYAQKHVSRLDSVQRLNEVVVLGNSQRSVIPSQQLKGEERGSRNLMGISVELCDSKEEKLFICHSMKISSEKFDFSIE